jgi:hypothetical protein
MNKTVLITEELHKRIKDCKIEIGWIEIKMSLARKIELFYDNYILDNTHETFWEFRSNNRDVWTKFVDDKIDEKIRNDKNWKNPLLITWKPTENVSI